MISLILLYDHSIGLILK